MASWELWLYSHSHSRRPTLVHSQGSFRFSSTESGILSTSEAERFKLHKVTPTYSVDQNKSQGKAQFKEWGITVHLLMRRKGKGFVVSNNLTQINSIILISLYKKMRFEGIKQIS